MWINLNRKSCRNNFIIELVKLDKDGRDLEIGKEGEGIWALLDFPLRIKVTLRVALLVEEVKFEVDDSVLADKLDVEKEVEMLLVV